MTTLFWNGTTVVTELTASNAAGPFAGLTAREAREYADSLQSVSVEYHFWNKLSPPAEYDPYGPFAAAPFHWIAIGSYDFSDDAEALYRVQVQSSLERGPLTVRYLNVFFSALARCSLRAPARRVGPSHGTHAHHVRPSFSSLAPFAGAGVYLGHSDCAVLGVNLAHRESAVQVSQTLPTCEEATDQR
jgi:hypothetical protein